MDTPGTRDLFGWSGKWPALLVFAAALLAYWPVLGGGFIWDDPGHITRADLRSWAGLARIWFEPGAAQQYYPVLHSAFWVEQWVFGDAPAGYHVVNVLLHATAACLLAAVLRRLCVPGALLAALLFALHPVAVESVAWISEQKNTLSAVLYLAAALVYLRFDETRRRSAYAWATLLFVLALGAKTVTATLPAALLVVTWWRRGRIGSRRDLGPLAPWFLLSVIAGIITAWVERTMIGAAGADFALGFVERLLLASRVLWFYLGKLVWPANLMFIYPRWTIDGSEAWQYLFPAGLVVLAVTLWKLRAPRGLAAALMLFAGTLFPALGFVNVFPFLYSFVADHFQYLASTSLFAVAAAGYVALSATWRRRWAYAVAGGVLVLLGAMTFRHSPTYGDVFVLYESTIARNPKAWMAHNNLGIALVDSGRVGEGVRHYEEALKLRPNFPQAENNLGFALNRAGNPAAAVPHFQRALQLQPRFAEAHNNLGIAFMSLGRTEEGRAEFEAALQSSPRYPEAHLNLGLALAQTGRTADAISHFREAARLKPDYVDAELNWAGGLAASGKFGEALPHFQRAVQIAPERADAHQMLGRALAEMGRLDEAIRSYRRALAIEPNLATARAQLVMTLRQAGRLQEAEREYRAAVEPGGG